MQLFEHAAVVRADALLHGFIHLAQEVPAAHHQHRSFAHTYRYMQLLLH
jgi:hypothetical protein